MWLHLHPKIEHSKIELITHFITNLDSYDQNNSTQYNENIFLWRNKFSRKIQSDFENIG